jgi:hypothetical protein
MDSEWDNIKEIICEWIEQLEDERLLKLIYEILKRVKG